MRTLPPIALLLAALVVVPVVHADADHLASPDAIARPAAVTASDSIAFAMRIMNENLAALSITNYGFIGNNFQSRGPSFEYPLGTGNDHMVRGGLWIGGITFDPTTAQVESLVTAGAVDGSQGSASASATEFTPASLGVNARSKLPNSTYYDRDAISENDYISWYSDNPAKKSIEGRENHRPLNVLVRQENYQWAFSNYNHFTIFHFVIKNLGTPIRNAYVGIYSEFVSVPKNSYSTWPASGIFNKKEIGWVDSLSMETERFCRSGPIPTNCFYSICPPLVGVKLLGVRPGTVKDGTKKVNWHAWNYGPGNRSRDEDVEKYALMADTLRTSLSPLPDSLAPVTGDPCELLSVGPFSTINPGDSISVDFAFIGSGTSDDLLRVANSGGAVSQQSILSTRARVAQKAYDLNYVVPTPPPSPRFLAVPREHAVDFYWDDSPERAVDPTSTAPGGHDFEGYRLYAGEDRTAPTLLAQFDLATAPNDTLGFNTGMGAVRLAQPKVINGVTYTYKYSLENLKDGYKYYCAVTSYDLGSSEIESLESGVSQNEELAVPLPQPGEHAGVTVFPNPYRVEAEWDQGKNARDHYLWFANLPEQCTIRIYTLSGDLVYQYEFDGRTYDGSNARGVYNRTSTDLKAHLSGATFAWDMITTQGQAAATGLYMYSVQPRNGGKREVGKFLIIKSDRESY